MPLRHGPRPVRLNRRQMFEKLGIADDLSAQQATLAAVNRALAERGGGDLVDALKDALEELCETNDSIFAAAEPDPNGCLRMMAGLAFDSHSCDASLLPLSLLQVAREPAAPEGWLPNCTITVYKESILPWQYWGEYRLEDFMDPDLGLAGDWIDPATLRYERLVQDFSATTVGGFNPDEHCVLWTPRELDEENDWAAFAAPRPEERRLTAENFVGVLEEAMDAFYLKDQEGRFLPEIRFIIRALSLDERLDNILAS